MESSLKPIRDFVIVKLHNSNDKYTSSGVEILVDTTWDKMKHMSATGEVVEPPKELVFIPGNRSFMEWETEMELKKGDHVVMKRTSVEAAKESSIKVDGEEYIFVKYEDCLVARRDWDGSGQLLEREGKQYSVIMLNGYLLITMKKLEEAGAVVLSARSKINHDKLGEVHFCGSLIKRYHPIYHQHGMLEDPGDGDEDVIRPGVTVLFNSPSWAHLENPIHSTIGKLGDLEFCRVQRNKILAIISNNEPWWKKDGQKSEADIYESHEAPAVGFVPRTFEMKPFR